MLNEGIHEYLTSSGNIKYKFRRGRSDRKHLLVIFSGFRHKGTLDFGGAAIDTIQHNVLWIFDEFGEPAENSYYLLQNGTFGPRDAVRDFLQQVCIWQGLEIADLTFAGFSKGASAALYHGLEMSVGAVVCTVPQFAIGSYVQKNWPAVFERMRAGRNSDAERTELDVLLPNVLDVSSNVNTHIYLFSSEADPQLNEEIKPNLERLRRLRFFNLILTESPLITQHIDVTPYNVPGILALFQLCADKIYPYFGEMNSIAETNSAVVQQQLQSAEGLAVLERAYAQNGRVELELTTLIRGIPQDNWGSTDRELILKGKSQESRLALGKTMDTALSRKYLQDTFIDYRAARSVSPRGAAYSLEAFPEGKSHLRVSMTAKNYGITATAPVKDSRPLFFHAVSGANLLVIRSEYQQVVAIRSDISTLPISSTAHTHTTQIQISDAKILHLQGIFAPYGTTVSEWGDISYYLVLQGEETYTYELGMLDREAEIAEQGLPTSLRKAYFADLGGRGVDLTTAHTGDYSLHILAVNKDVQVKSREIGRISVLEKSDAVSVAIIGSCVVRDVFNSTFVADWRGRSSLVAASHQSSLVSLTAASSPLAAESLSDLDSHSTQCVLEDFSKSVLHKMVTEKPDYVLIDLFSDVCFGVAELADGSMITNNDWKIGLSAAYKTLDIRRKITLQNNEEEYLKLFRKSLRILKEALGADRNQGPIFAIVSVRAAEWLRSRAGQASQQIVATEMLNSGFEKLEAVTLQEMPDAIFLDLKKHNVWADAEHPWSPYVVHFEQAYYNALDQEIRQLTHTQRVLSPISFS